MSDSAGKPSLRGIYREQRASDKANQSTASKLIGLLFPVLLVVGIALHGSAGTVFTLVCAAVAVVCLVAFVILLKRQRAGAG